jgi:hypothetical protein
MTPEQSRAGWARARARKRVHGQDPQQDAPPPGDPGDAGISTGTAALMFLALMWLATSAGHRALGRL